MMCSSCVGLEWRNNQSPSVLQSRHFILNLTSSLCKDVTTVLVFCLFQNRKSLHLLKDTLLLSDRNDWSTRRPRRQPSFSPCMLFPLPSLILRAPRWWWLKSSCPLLNLGLLAEIFGLNKLGLFGVFKWFIKLKTKLFQTVLNLLAVKCIKGHSNEANMTTGNCWKICAEQRKALIKIQTSDSAFDVNICVFSPL